MSAHSEGVVSERVEWPATIGGWSQTFAVCDGRQALIERWMRQHVVATGNELQSWPTYIAEGAASKVRAGNWMEAVR